MDSLNNTTIYDLDEISDVYMLVKLILYDTFRYDIKGPKTILSHREDLVVGNTIVVKCNDIIRDAIIVHISNDIVYLLNLKNKLSEQFRKEQEKSITSIKERGKNIINASRKMYRKYSKRYNAEKENSILSSNETFTDVSLKKKKMKMFSRMTLRPKKKNITEDPFNLYSRTMKMQNSEQEHGRVPDITHQGPTYNSLLSTRKQFSVADDYIALSSDEDDGQDDSNNLFGSKNIFTRTSISGSEDNKSGSESKRTQGYLSNMYGQKKIKQT
ncbi:PREDICTED: uncharacterized protein LOC108560905 [Nicrophorus vespilloides]|uniref:Uncharacterized protein LOC108560905 n=1 Tax=Nicrophorus vespilloides TaxID=110193 RepID=A0ABM1MHR5_NICVS|nr:PREDICTED: uncharacterized protein LOC108560905 [Nicrophorus vespilloides]